jgi:Ca2+-binding RTX toxin-like protein
VIGSAYADTISLASGTSGGVIEGRSGGDTLTGSGQADYIFGEAGADTLHGGTGADTLSGGDDDDTINGNDGADSIEGGAGDDILNGGDDVDTLFGGDDDDTLDGGDGADYLMGGDGDDILIVNNDHWSLEGGDGDDSYWFTSTTSVTLDWTLEYRIESDANGSIKYDGILIVSGAARLEETIGVGAQYLDATGTSYGGGEGALWIWLPTNEAIYVSGWANGDMGIYLPGL